MLFQHYANCISSNIRTYIAIYLKKNPKKKNKKKLPKQSINKRRLASASSPYNADLLLGQDLQRQVLQDWGLVRRVVQEHVLELKVT